MVKQMKCIEEFELKLTCMATKGKGYREKGGANLSWTDDLEFKYDCTENSVDSLNTQHGDKTGQMSAKYKRNWTFINSLFSFHASQMTIISGSVRKCLLDSFLRIDKCIPQHIRRTSMQLGGCQTLCFNSFKRDFYFTLWVKGQDGTCWENLNHYTVKQQQQQQNFETIWRMFFILFTVLFFVLKRLGIRFAISQP